MLLWWYTIGSSDPFVHLDPLCTKPTLEEITMKRLMHFVLTAMIILAGLSMTGCSHLSSVINDFREKEWENLCQHMVDANQNKAEEIYTSTISTQTETEKTQPHQTYTVVECLEAAQDGIEIRFEYVLDKNCVQAHVFEDGELIGTYLIYVNKDGAITSAHFLTPDGQQCTEFEETEKGYPITTYNDAGCVYAIEYENCRLSFLYNNYVDNVLTGLEWFTWDLYDGWQYQDDVSIAELEDEISEYFAASYTEVTDARYCLFFEHMGTFMIFLQEIIYDIR